MSEIHIDELMERIRAEVKQRKGGAEIDNWTASAGFSTKSPLSTISSHSDREDFEIKDEYHINDFLKFRDRNFMMMAYRCILKRGPDAGGLKYFLNNLRSGKMTKAEVLGRLRYAPEGRGKKVKVKGLFWNFVIQSSFRIPVFGYCTRLASGIGNLPLILHNMRMFEERASIQLESQRNDLAKKTEELLQNIEQLKAVVNTKTDSGKLDVLKNEIDAALEIKADRAELEIKADRAELEIKADRAELEIKADRAELEFKADKEQIQNITGQIHEIFQQTRDHKRNILDQQRRLMLLLEEARKRLPEPISTDQIEKMLTEEDHLLDAMYASFENQFRGTREDIKQRQSIYLPFIREVGAGTVEAPILDLGCGRGEWLEFLKDADLIGRGVDLNHIFLKECLELGLDVVEQDAVAYLRSLKPQSIGTVTSFHLIEHLPLKVLIALLDETLRVLKPGGMVILETPNPANVLVGSCNFYMDPTHRNPLPGPLTQYLLEARGFFRTHFLPLHPFGETEDRIADGGSQVEHVFNKFFFGPQDYAVLGYKSHS